MLFRDAASAFIRHCQSIRKLSPHTIRAYELDLARFSQFFGKRAAVAACDKTVIHNYVRHLFDVHTLKESSVKRHLATLRRLRELESRGEEVLAGGYRLRSPEDPRVAIVVMGALVPEAISAADILADEAGWTPR